MGMMVTVGILGGRQAEQWPDQSSGVSFRRNYPRADAKVERGRDAGDFREMQRCSAIGTTHPVKSHTVPSRNRELKRMLIAGNWGSQ